MKKYLLLAVCALLAWPVWAQHRTANTDVYYGRRATLFDVLPIGRNDIIMLGNSLTDGGEWNELLGNRHVKNRGIVGDIVQGCYERMEPILMGQPRKIEWGQRCVAWREWRQHSTSHGKTRGAHQKSLASHQNLPAKHVAV